MGMKYSYEKYLEDTNVLLNKVKASKIEYSHIVGIIRGGCILGVHLSNVLDIPFTPLVWSHTRNEKDRNLGVLRDPKNNCLIVDDILDQGSTLVEVMKEYPNVDTGVLIYNCVNQFSIVPTYASWTINRNDTPEWFDFWWEKI